MERFPNECDDGLKAYLNEIEKAQPMTPPAQEGEQVEREVWKEQDML
ncbi:hypothetical protein [Prosthecobacter sp.]